MCTCVCMCGVREAWAHVLCVRVFACTVGTRVHVICMLRCAARLNVWHGWTRVVHTWTCAHISIMFHSPQTTRPILTTPPRPGPWDPQKFLFPKLHLAGLASAALGSGHWAWDAELGG